MHATMLCSDSSNSMASSGETQYFTGVTQAHSPRLTGTTGSTTQTLTQSMQQALCCTHAFMPASCHGMSRCCQADRQNTSCNACVLHHSDLLDSHELASIIVQTKIDAPKCTCPHHLADLPVDLLPDREALHTTGSHSPITLWPACWYTVCMHAS